MNALGILYLAALAIAIGAGNILLSSLAGNTVPAAMKPLAHYWSVTGRNQKCLRFFMWVLFAICAFTFVVLIVYRVYPAVIQLGQKWTR